jgi:hypothetical protein
MSGQKPRFKHTAVSAAVITGIILLTSLTYSFSSSNYNDSPAKTNTATLKESAIKTPAKALEQLADISDPNFYKSSPVAKVETFEADNSWAKVIYLPQYHKYPGTEIKDPKNDRALIAQKETYVILEKILKTFPIKSIMVEGELKGEVANKKKNNIKEKIVIAKQLEEGLSSLKEIFRQNEKEGRIYNDALKNGEKLLSELNREIYLAGAPYVLWSNIDDIELYGSENSDTITLSRDLVREHLYIQDRMLAVQNNNFIAQNIERPTTTFNYETNNTNTLLMQLLKTNNDPHEELHKNLDRLKDSNQNKAYPKMLLQIDKLLETCELYMKHEEQETNNIRLSSVPAPSRTDNPYKNIFNPQELNQLLKQNEEKIDSVVVNRRNAELATNFSELLKSKNENIGILQFGAGHLEGLIEEFNKLGITVIIVTPNKVASS